MVLIHLPYSPNARHHMLVAQLAAQRITRICRINDDATRFHECDSLSYQPQLWIIGMNGKELSQVEKLF
jgi:hypothetical protein